MLSLMILTSVLDESTPIGILGAAHELSNGSLLAVVGASGADGIVPLLTGSLADGVMCGILHNYVSFSKIFI